VAQAQKLRLLLAKITVKQSLNQALTPDEMNLLAECQRVSSMTPVEYIKHDADGSIHIVKQHNVEPIIQAMHDYKDVVGSHQAKNGAKLVGSIDTITAAVWANESGTRIGTREFAIYAKKKLNDRDFHRFRAGGA